MHTYFVSTIRNLAIPKGRADDDGIRAEAVEGEYYYIDTNKNGQISSTPTHFETTVTTLHLLGNMYNNNLFFCSSCCVSIKSDQYNTYHNGSW